MRRAILIAVGLILWVVTVADGAGANPIVTLAGAKQFAAALNQSPPNATLKPVVPPNSTQSATFHTNTAPTTLAPNTSPFNGLGSGTGSAANLNSANPINGGYVYAY